MPISDFRFPNEERSGLRPYEARCRANASVNSPSFSNRLYHSAFGNRKSAFTLIELLVAVGLMAILLTMIATIFYEATQAFRQARASIEIHESARSALNALVNDLTAAGFSSYDTGVQGYFAVSGYLDPDPKAPTVTYPTLPTGSANPPLSFDTLTFTTLAAQPGARYAAAEAVEQLALVRYALEWDGGSAALPGARAPRPTYNLVKRVRFPNTSNSSLNMDAFPLNPNPNMTNLPNNNTANYTSVQQYIATNPSLQVELDQTDPNAVQYAESEPIAFHVLSMNVRLFCLPAKQTSETSEAFVDAGLGSPSAPAPSLTDAVTTYSKNWPDLPNFLDGLYLRILTGSDAGDVSVAAPIPTNPLGLIWKSTSTGPAPYTNTIQCNGIFPFWKTTSPSANSEYRVETPTLATLFPSNPPPAWYQRSTTAYNYNFFGPTYRPPAVVEVTLEMTDARATHSFIFTQRFYIPASER